MTTNPLIIGVGGLLEKDENGRVTEILENLRESGCSTYEVKFTSIFRNGETVLCPVSTAWVSEIDATVRTALQDPNIDTTRIGLIGSSLGATIMDQYLASENDINGTIPYVAISPFSRINPRLIPMLETARSAKKDIPITSEIDRKRGINRTIPHSSISTILGIDTTQTARQVKNNHKIVPLTVYGLNDERVEVASIEERHRVLNGKDNKLKGFDCKHNTPYKESIELATEFLRTNLLN
jgi:hypothetical protein